MKVHYIIRNKGHS